MIISVKDNPFQEALRQIEQARLHEHTHHLANNQSLDKFLGQDEETIRKMIDDRVSGKTRGPMKRRPI